VDAQGRLGDGRRRGVPRGDGLRRACRHPIARLVTARHTTDLVGGSVRRAEVADDRVAVRSESETVATFREVEVELFDADEELIDAVMSRLHSAGAGEPDSTPKYVRALRALGHEV
jgi:hypothetical protein